MLRLIACLLAALALAGCAGKAELTTRYIETDDAKTMAASKVAATNLGQAEAVQANLAGPQSQAREHLGSSAILLGSVPAPEEQRYLEGIRDRLLAQWPYQKPPAPKIEITCGDDYNAESSSADVIQLPMGVIKSAQSEDELAFVLGHEIGHIVLQHQARREQSLHDTETGVQIVAGAGMLAALIATGHRGIGGQVTADLGKAAPGLIGAVAGETAIAEVITSVIDPGWSRKQEEQADWTGVDLMVAAGYNPSDADDAFVAILKQEQTAAKAKQELDQQIEAQRQAEGSAAKVGGSVNDLFSSVGNFLTELRVNHPSTAEREKAAGEYRDKFYSREETRHSSTKALEKLRAARPYKNLRESIDHARHADNAIAAGDNATAVKEARAAERSLPAWWGPHYLAGLAMLNQGPAQARDARAELLRASTSGAPYAVYERATLEFSTAGDFATAHKVLDAAVKNFGGPDITWPDRIALYRDQKNQILLTQTLQACKASSNPRLREACDHAAVPPLISDRRKALAAKAG